MNSQEAVESNPQRSAEALLSKLENRGKVSFNQRLLSDVRVVVSIIDDVIRGSAGLKDTVRLKQTLHKIATTATSYGQPQHTRIARLLERALESIQHDGMDAIMRDLLSAKSEQLVSITHGMSQEKAEVSAGVDASEKQTGSTEPVSKDTKDGFWSINTLFVGDLNELCKALQLRSYKSMCVSFEDLKSLRVRSLHIVVNQSSVEHNENNMAIFKEYLDQLRVKPKVVFITADKTPDAVRASFRFGADCCVNKSDVVSYLLDHQQNARHEREMTVAVLDDDASVFNKMTSNLKFLGINTIFSNNIDEFIEKATVCPPDLFIIDMALESQLTGIEAIKYLRNHDLFSSHPIVLLTSDTRPETDYLARNLGADDVLHKPIDEKQFSSIVAHKLIRARRLTGRITRDFLTDLTTQSAYDLALEQRIQYAVRNQANLSLCVIDVDNLKSLNDQYGHLHGDDILKALADALKNRLRASDVIAKCAGGRFALVLPDTSVEDAKMVVSDILYRFSSRIFEFSGNEQCQAGFSAGVAELNELDSTALRLNPAPCLEKLASQALIEAKASGKQCVMRHPFVVEPNTSAN